MSTFTSMMLREFGQPLERHESEELHAGPGELIVDVEYAGVCGTDIHISDGRMPAPLPVVMGHEATGRVRELGDGVSTDSRGVPLVPGTVVTWASSIPCGRCYYCVQEQELSLCENRVVYGINQGIGADGSGGNGGYAGQIRLRAGSTVIALPDGLSPEDVVALGCAGPTAVHAMSGPAGPIAGDFVVVQGSGPVGLACAMYAKLAGAAEVVLFGAPAGRLELARELGVGDHVVSVEATTPDERVAMVQSLSPGGRGADLVVEATGQPQAVDEGMRMTRRNGRYLVVGQYTDHGPTPLNPHLITKGQLHVHGSWAFTGGDYLTYVDSLTRLIARFDVSRLATTFPLTDANEALAAMRSGTVAKALLKP